MSVAATNATQSTHGKQKDLCPFPHDTTGAIARQRLQVLHASNFSLGWGNDDIKLGNGRAPKQYYALHAGDLSGDLSLQTKGPKAGYFGSQLQIRDDWGEGDSRQHKAHALLKRDFVNSEVGKIFAASGTIHTQVQPKEPHADGTSFKSTLASFAAIGQVSDLVDALREKLAEKGVR